ncbi:MAG: epimerase, partial [Polaromonas sp.]|nr:epimerase [Polaromonas sp.]
HRVLRGGRNASAHSSPSPSPSPGEVTMDFTLDTAESVWLPRLAGVDAVINAVGVLRDGPRTPMQAIHSDVPQALFNACAQQGVRRVIHLSALGIASGDSPYARTKREAEAHLQNLTAQGALQGVALQPSVVFGAGGAGSALFTALARWPVLALPPEAFSTRVQPVRLDELAQVVAALIEPAGALCGPLVCVGPLGVPLADLIASLRQQRGYAPARVMRLPSVLTRASARLGDAFPFTPWGTQALALLAQDNTADPAPFARLLGRPATAYSQLLTRPTTP